MLMLIKRVALILLIILIFLLIIGFNNIISVVEDYTQETLRLVLELV
jgi:hypothetical protein